MMKKMIKSVLIYLLASKKFLLQFATDKNSVVALIESLHPVRTEFELIRLGPDGDGGYLVPDSLDGIEAVFSPGVATMSDFELDCLKHHMKVYMADKSVERPNLQISEEEYHFIKKFVGCTCNEENITMDEWVQSANLESGSSDLLLQMDIEGCEYISLINMSDALIKRFRIMVIEFHTMQHLWDPQFFNVAGVVFRKILQTHSCVHIHPNNCSPIDTQFGIQIPKVLEFTFLRNDSFKHRDFACSFPHKLDFDNTNNEHIILPKNWYKRTGTK